MDVKTIIKYTKCVFVHVIFFLTLFSSCVPTKYLKKDEYWLFKQNIHINNVGIEKKKIKKYLQQKTNKLLFGIPVPVYFYNSVNPEKEALREKKRKPREDLRSTRRQLKGKEPKPRFYISRWLLKIGEPISVFNDYANAKTKENILDYMKSKGYYYSTVQDSFEYEGQKMWLNYMITTNEPYIIDSFSYDIKNKDILSILKNDSAKFKLGKGVVFDSDLLKSERLRITKLLKSKSYFLFKKEYIQFLADTNKRNKTLKLTLKIQNPNNFDARIESNHRKFKINNIHVYLGYDPREELAMDKDYLESFESLVFGNIIFHYKGKSVLDPNVILRGLYVKGDSLYNYTDVEKTYQYLTNLHVFKLININFRNTTSGGFIRDSKDSYGLLDCIIKLTTELKQSYSLEGEMNLSSYGDFGAAANVGYQNHNLWRKAISLEIKNKAARENIYYQNGDINELFKVNIIGGEIKFQFPKFLVPPFIFGEKILALDNKYKPKTNLTIDVDYQNRFDFTNFISTFSYGYQFKTSEKATHTISIAEFSTTKVFDIQPSYIDFVFANDIWSSYFDNVLLGMSYHYVYSDHNITKFDDARVLRFGVELSGNLLALVNRLFNLGEVQIPYTDRFAKSVLGLPYFQFGKIDFEYRRYFLLANGQQLVFRTLLGVGIPYGNVKFMPIQKQYYSGGANSIRAWQPKRLGPGSLDVSTVVSEDNSSSFNSIFQNSDMKIEFNVEHRFKIFWKLDGALFLDMGNIWSLSNSKFEEQANFKFNKFYKDIAIGTGAGIRLNFDFFVARIDLGIRLFDPVLAGSNWSWKSNVSHSDNFNFNFSIGYPF